MKTPIDIVREMRRDYLKECYENVPGHAPPPGQYSDKVANSITRCILDFLRRSGWQAERISSTGRMVDNRKVVRDVFGNLKLIGSTTWIKESGAADISATIAGRSCKIEVKVGKDRQSPEQLRYQQEVEAAGGLYFIARDFGSFFKWYIFSFPNAKPVSWLERHGITSTTSRTL